MKRDLTPISSVSADLGLEQVVDAVQRQSRLRTTPTPVWLNPPLRNPRL